MQIKINEKIISIPPYISTTWSQIAALRMKGSRLSIVLKGGEAIDISHLEEEQILHIFSFHAAYLESSLLEKKEESGLFSALVNKELPNFLSGSSLSISLGSIDGLSSIAQHDSKQANAPDLPPSVLAKIGEMAQIIFSWDDENQPRPEPHCNCFHCQIARAVENKNSCMELIENDFTVIHSEEEVTEEELQFQQWQIDPVKEQLYQVTNRLDTTESYHVFLGSPIGCTCGKKDCEHLIAVLKN